MAVLGTLTLNEILIYEVDASPAITGLAAPSGSLAIMTDGSGIFQKGEGNDFDWSPRTLQPHAFTHLPQGSDPLSTGVPNNIGTSNSEGTANAFARQDHIHNHGSQTNPTHHSVVTQSNNGFMSSTDKTKLDNVNTIATHPESDLITYALIFG